MSKFRRVAETQEVPEIIERVFQPKEENDMFAELRAGATKRKLKIAKETMGYEEETPKDRSWERITQASVYSDHRLAPADEDMSNLNPEDAMSNSIRRASYEVDNGLNARDFKWCTPNDALNILSGASIFNPEFEEISEALVQDNSKREAMFKSAQQREVELAAKHKQWEEEQRANLCPRKVISSRANAILRTSVENTAAGRFGLPDIDAIERREEERARILEAKRQQKMAISRKGYSPEERHSEWEDGVNLRASRIQDAQSSWLDNFLDD